MGRYQVAVYHVGTLYYVDFSSVGPVWAIQPDCSSEHVSTSSWAVSQSPRKVLHLHAGHVPQTEPGMWAKSPITRPWLTGCLLSIRILGRPPREPSGSYWFVLSTLSFTVFLVVLTVA